MWLNELPEDTAYDEDEVFRYTQPAEAALSRSICAALEIALPRSGHPSTYGLVGGSFTPDDSSVFTLEVAASNQVGHRIDWALPKETDLVRSGLSKRTSEYILERVALREPASVLGSGLLRVDHSAEGIVGSSPAFSAWLAVILLRLLALGPDMELLTNPELGELIGSEPFR